MGKFFQAFLTNNDKKDNLSVIMKPRNLFYILLPVFLAAILFPGCKNKDNDEKIQKLRGRFFEYKYVESAREEEKETRYCSIPVLFTYHPDAVLNDESLKRPAFEDMKLLMAHLADLDRRYVIEVKELLQKYSAVDSDFAARVMEHLT